MDKCFWKVLIYTYNFAEDTKPIRKFLQKIKIRVFDFFDLKKI